MNISYSDLPKIKEFILDRQLQLEELRTLPPTAENMRIVRKITAEARDLERSLKELRGKYPYAV